MIDPSRDVTGDAIEEWMRAFQSDTYWRAEMEPIVRTTLAAMEASDTGYTGDDFYEILLSSTARQEFVTAEHSEAGSLAETLGAADPAVLETLSRRIHQVDAPTAR